jgi:prevent-host-death family protein
MPLNQTTTETVTVDEARERFEELLSRSVGRDRRVVIEREGTPVAALISFADLERFDLLLTQQEREFEVLRQISRAFGDASDEEVEREANEAIARIRAKAREERRQKAIVGQ